jgi:hypothetical protein
MSLGEMAYAVLYALHLIPVLLFHQKRQVLEPIKMSHGQLKAVPSGLFCLLLCALAGDYSLSLQDGEPDQISIPSLVKR